MSNFYDWSVTPSDNDDSDGSMTWAEFQAPSSVNDGVRQLMARLAEWRRDLAGSIVTAGSGSAYTLTISSTIGPSYPDGLVVWFTADRANGGSSTLSVNGGSAVPLRAKSGAALPTNAIQAAYQYSARYRSSTNEFIVSGTTANVQEIAPTLMSAQVFGLRVGDPVISFAPTPNAGFLRLTETVQAVNKASYPDLNTWASGLGYPWGSASTTFNLPPAAGYFLRFAGTSSSIDPGGARSAGSTQTDEIKGHTHTGTTDSGGSHSHTVQVEGRRWGGDAQSTSGLWSDTGNAIFTATPYTVPTSTAAAHAHAFTTASTGGAETRPKNVAFHLDILASPPLVASGLIGTVGYSYKYSSTTTAADPGAGYVRFDNATLSSATALYISETDGNSGDLSGALATWASSTSTIKGRIRFVAIGAPAVFAEFDILGSRVDNGAWNTFTIVHRASNGTIGNTDRIHVTFVPTGDAGAGGLGSGDVVGPLSAVDNRLAAFDGTTGKLVKDSGRTIASVPSIVTTTRGDIIRRGASADERLALGTSGYALMSDGTDPAWTGFVQAGTGAVTRTWQDKARDVVDLRDFGVSPSASAATNTAGINAAFAYAATLSRSRIDGPAGQIDVNGQLNITGNNVAFVGAGKDSTVFVQNTPGSKTFNVTGSNSKLRGLQVYYATAGTAGGDAVYCSGARPNFADICADRAYRGFAMEGATTGQIHDIVSTSHVANGVSLKNTIDINIIGGYLNAGNDTNGSLGNLRMQDQCEGSLIVGLTCLAGQRGIAVDVTTPGWGTQPAWTSFSACIFDAAVKGNVIKGLVGGSFSGCFFSGGRSDTGYHGLTLDACQNIDLHAPRVLNCGRSGIYIKNTCSQVRITVPDCSSNSTTSGSGVGHGIELEANTSNVTVLYPSGGNATVPGGQQGYDVLVNAGTSNNVVIRTNSIGGVTGIISSGGVGAGNIYEVGSATYGGALYPAVNDGAALGGAGQAWADAHLASGGVVNWDSGNYTLTHSADVLTANKDFRVTTAGTNAASVVTVGGTQTLTNKTLTSPTLTTATLNALTTLGGNPAGNIGLLMSHTVDQGGSSVFGLYMAQTLRPASGQAAYAQYSGGTIDTTNGTVSLAAGFFASAFAKTGANNITTVYGAYFPTQTVGVANWSMYAEGDALFGGLVRINQAASTVGTGTKTISNGADSSTNFGKYFSINLNGTTVYIPCSTVAPT